MRRFKAAWKAFWVVMRDYGERGPYFAVLWHRTQPFTTMTNLQRDYITAILSGAAHARRYPAKKGDRGFRMEGGRG